MVKQYFLMVSDSANKNDALSADKDSSGKINEKITWKSKLGSQDGVKGNIGNF